MLKQPVDHGGIYKDKIGPNTEPCCTPDNKV